MMVSAWRAVSCGRCSQLPWSHGVCTWPAINEPHEGKRRAEALWPIHQINNQRSCVAWARCKQRPVLHVADCLPAVASAVMSTTCTTATRRFQGSCISTALTTYVGCSHAQPHVSGWWGRLTVPWGDGDAEIRRCGSDCEVEEGSSTRREACM